MNRSLILPWAALFLPPLGCGGEPKETWVMAGESAPVFDGGDVGAFVQGRWAVIEMMMGDEEPNWIEFGADGRFLYNMGGVEAGGAWKTGPKALSSPTTSSTANPSSKRWMKSARIPSGGCPAT
jgi:hypothetical protein